MKIDFGAWDFSLIFFWVIFGGVLFLFLLALIFGRRRKRQVGTVIILDGYCASSKSVIQHEFQKLLLPELWIKVGVKNLFDEVLPDVSNTDIGSEQKQKDASSRNCDYYANGEDDLTEVAYGMNAAIAAYARAGCNVMVDYVAYKKEWVDDLQAQLAGYNVWYKLSSIGASRRTFFNNEKSVWGIDFITSYSSYRMPKVTAYFVKVDTGADGFTSCHQACAVLKSQEFQNSSAPMHDGIIYDLVVQPYKKNPSEIAQEIRLKLLADKK